MNKPILSVECLEKDKKVLRSVYLMDMTIENLTKFWTLSRQYPTLFGQKINDDFGSFCEVFLHYDRTKRVEGNGIVWVIDDFVGVFYMTDIYLPEDAMVHVSFLDGRMRGREPLVKAMLEYVFDRYGFNRLSAQVPMFAVPKGYQKIIEEGKSPLEFGFFKFIQNCVFKQEGRKRKCSFYKDQYFDAISFGILKEEVLNGK